jgi:hypothetical protein
MHVLTSPVHVPSLLRCVPQLDFINAREQITRLVDEPFAFVDAPDFTPTYPDPSNPGQRLPYTKLDSEICQPDGLLWGGRTPTGGSQALPAACLEMVGCSSLHARDCFRCASLCGV